MERESASSTGLAECLPVAFGSYAGLLPSIGEGPEVETSQLWRLEDHQGCRKDFFGLRRDIVEEGFLVSKEEEPSNMFKIEAR